MESGTDRRHRRRPAWLHAGFGFSAHLMLSAEGVGDVRLASPDTRDAPLIDPALQRPCDMARWSGYLDRPRHSGQPPFDPYRGEMLYPSTRTTRPARGHAADQPTPSTTRVAPRKMGPDSDLRRSSTRSCGAGPRRPAHRQTPSVMPASPATTSTPHDHDRRALRRPPRRRPLGEPCAASAGPAMQSRPVVPIDDPSVGSVPCRPSAAALLRSGHASGRTCRRRSSPAEPVSPSPSSAPTGRGAGAQPPDVDSASLPPPVTSSRSTSFRHPIGPWDCPTPRGSACASAGRRCSKRPPAADPQPPGVRQHGPR